MPTKITMPQLGESVVEGTVVDWLKQEGDTVEEYEPVVVIDTDKVSSEIPAPVDGVILRIYVHEGETVQAGELLAMVGEPGETIPDVSDGRLEEMETGNGARAGQPTPQPARTRASSGKYTGHVTPVVARMAEAHDLDLSNIEGSGRDGRITKKDVEAYLEQIQQPDEAPEAAPWEQPVEGDLFKPTVEYGGEAEEQTEEKPDTAIPQPAATPRPADKRGELTDLTPIRRSIAEHMVRSKLLTSPHVTTVFEVDMSAVIAHREANKDGFAKQRIRLTYTPYFVAASVVALREHPMMNSQWTDEGIFLHHAMNIGIAVAIDEGLIVPVITNAQDYNLTGLARKVNDLSERARSRQLEPDEVQNGTFTITNHGVSGSLFASPIINQPQVAILGVGTIEKRVKVINDAIAIRPCAYVSLTFDHRVLDGAIADHFLATLKGQLEGWS